LFGVRGRFIIRKSLLERHGACYRACAYRLHVGDLDLLRVERSPLHEIIRGCRIKSRALRTESTDCTVENGPDAIASSEADISNGGSPMVNLRANAANGAVQALKGDTCISAEQ
jgi:hypothetical protein